MKRGLLLAAFIVTLVLDMGGGPVFIVYAALNLNKNASFPAATWLLVRGIFNCIQFLTVMALCYQVNRIKRLYSHKEEYLVVCNLLATHPVAFFYYCIILGGVVWNSLGSGWISTAFRDYNRGFGICYLVCIILSWISVIVSPTFVFCGGLVYKRKATVEPPRDNEGLLDTLLEENEVIFDIQKVLAQFQQEGVTLSVDDILWRDQFRQKEMSPKEPFPSMDETVTPVIVTGIHSLEHSADQSLHHSMFEDLAKDLQEEGEPSESVMKIVSDVLDDEVAGVSEEDQQLREIIQQKAVIQEVPVSGDSSVHSRSCGGDSLVHSRIHNGDSSTSLATHSNILIPLHINSSTLPNNNSSTTPHILNPSPSTNSINSLRSQNNSRKEKKTKRRYSKKEQPKECIVSVDSIIPETYQHTTNTHNIGGIQENEAFSDYVDLSQQMIHQINSGAFDKNSVNENVNVSYIS